MTVLRALAWSVIGVSAFSVLGCSGSREGHARQDRVHEESQARYVQQSPQYAEPQPQYVIVQQAPPPLIVERQPAPPSGAYVWIGGSWNWGNQRYNWQAGHYAVPPQADAVWVAPRYDKDTRGYRYTPGQWQKQKPGKATGHDPGKVPDRQQSNASGRDHNDQSAQRQDENR